MDNESVRWGASLPAGSKWRHSRSSLYAAPLASLEKQLGLGRVLEQQLHWPGMAITKPQDVSHMVLLT